MCDKGQQMLFTDKVFFVIAQLQRVYLIVQLLAARSITLAGS